MLALLACDDTVETAILSLALQLAGVNSSLTGDLNKALRSWPQRPADMVLLSLRRGSALELTRRVRGQTEVPLVLICNAHNEDVLCQVLEAGADLVIPRPYSVRLLAMQLRALLRRTGRTPALGLPTLVAGQLSLDSATREVQVEGGPPRRLTRLEFRLLYVLMMHQGQTLPAATIIERVWGYTGEGDVELVRNLVFRLRAKVEADPKNPRLIRTIPGVGYQFSSPVGSPATDQGV